MNELKGIVNITAERLRLVVILFEAIWISIGVFVYSQYPDIFFRYAPFMGIVNALTLMPLPGIFKVLRQGESEEILYDASRDDESDQEPLGVWERSCIWYFVITNSVLIAIMVMLLFF